MHSLLLTTANSILCLLLGAGLVLAAETGTPMAAGDRYAERGQIAEAIDQYREVLRRDPRSVQAHMKLAGMELLAGHYTESIQLFQASIGLDPSNAKAFVGLAMAYLHLGQYGAARAALAEAKRLDPVKQPDIDGILVWLDARSPVTPKVDSPPSK